MDKLTLLRKGIETGVYPNILYKYRSMNRRTDEIICNSSIWFSNPFSFNDPFDFQIEDKGGYSTSDIEKYLVDAGVTKNKIKNILLEVEKNKSEVTKIVNNVKDRVFDKKGVLCLSQDPKNVLMWSHYSQDHTGIVFGFKLKKDLEFFLTPITVKYLKTLPSIQYLKEKDKIVTHCIQRKYSEWVYEKEVRIIKDKSGSVSFKKECLVEIIFGCKAKISDINLVKKLVKCAGYTSVTFYQAKKLKSSFKLGLSKI